MRHHLNLYLLSSEFPPQLPGAVPSALAMLSFCVFTKADLPDVASGFRSMRGIRGCIGCIDGSHVPVRAPLCVKSSYLNRKGWTSLSVLAICDHRMRFRYCVVGAPGAVHDARVWRSCSLFTKLLRSVGDRLFYILGDPAYALMHFWSHTHTLLFSSSFLFSLFLPLCLSLSFYLSVALSLCFSLSLCVSLSLSLFFYFISLARACSLLYCGQVHCCFHLILLFVDVY